MSVGRFLQQAAAGNAGGLPDPFDLSTAGYDSVTFYTGSQAGNPRGLRLSEDGTKMYVADFSNEQIYQYSLSTADDVSTASYDSVSFTPQKSASNVPVAVLFSSDGTKMYVINSDTSSTVYQYSLSTEFDLSTASYDSISLDVESQSQLMQAMAFTTDQTKMLLIDSTNDNVFQYS